MSEFNHKYAYEVELGDEGVAGTLLSWIRKNTRVLELGCASGSMTKAIVQYRECSVCAIELDAEQAQLARPYCDRLVVGNLETIDIKSTFAGQRFDYILVADVLEHLQNPGAVLGQLIPLLDTAGEVLLSTPNIAYAGIVSSLMSGRFEYAEKGLLDQTHVHFYTRYHLENELIKAGLLPFRWHAVRLSPLDSEFSHDWKRLSGEVQRAILEDPDTSTYQWVVASRVGNTETVQSFLAEKNRDLLDLHHQKKNANIRLANLVQEKLSLRDEVAQLQLQCIERDETINAFRAQYSGIMDSTSWKITAPLRKVAATLGKLRILARMLVANLFDGKSLVFTGGKIVRVLKKEGFAGLTRRWSYLSSESVLDAINRNDYSKWVDLYENQSEVSRATALAARSGGPKISILLPTFNPDSVWFVEAVNSVKAQSYQNWELCIADDASTTRETRGLIENLAAGDARIRHVFREKNGHISAASNSALGIATGNYVTLLDHDDILAPDALFHIAQEIIANPSIQLIYSDEDKLDAAGQRRDPHFKPDWNYDLLLSYNYLCHLTVFSTTLLEQLGGFREGYEGAQDYDLVLRASEVLRPEEIAHIPLVLYHWRMHESSTSNEGAAKPYALLNGRRAIVEHLERKGVAAEVIQLPEGIYRVSYHLPGVAPHVSIIIPTRNGVSLLRQCISSILEKTDYPNYDILIVDNGSDDPSTLMYLSGIEQDQRVSVIRDDRSFNYSELNNAAVKVAQGEYVALLNNDIEVISTDWLKEMVSVAVQPGVGAVGARLWYPNDTLQHGGVILVGGVAGHSHKGLPKGLPGYARRATVMQSFSAVTAACLLVRKRVFDEVGGLDEENLAVAFNDVDFCLKIMSKGYRNVWNPYAELYHHESATRGYEDTPEKKLRFQREVFFMKRKWKNLLKNDPAYNPNLTLEFEDFSLAWPPRRKAGFSANA